MRTCSAGPRLFVVKMGRPGDFQLRSASGREAENRGHNKRHFVLDETMRDRLIYSGLVIIPACLEEYKWLITPGVIS